VINESAPQSATPSGANITKGGHTSSQEKYDITMKKKLNGFTLVELIVSMALLAILMIMIGLMFRPIGRLLADTTNYTEDRYVIDEMNEIIDSHLKFATGVEIYYDVAGYNAMDSTAAGTALGVAYPRWLEIRNVSANTYTTTALGYDPNEYDINGTTTYTAGRIVKKDNEHGLAWMAGSKAFYGSGNYFVNLETSSGSPMVASNRLQFTTYAINEEWAFADDIPTTQEYMLETTFRDQEPDSCLGWETAGHQVVSNYSTHEVVFVNSPTVNLHDGGAGGGGVNIMIYYKLPGDV